jgi:hypothetical protein
MTAIVLRLAGALVLTAVAAGAVVALGLASLEDTAGAALLAAAALGLLAAVRAVHEAVPPVRPQLFERSLRRRVEPFGRPADLTRLEVDLAFGAESASQLHSRVVPLLRQIASSRLASRHGVDLGHRPDAAHALLGDDAWELVRPDRPAPEDLLARGLPLRRVAETVSRLEDL